MINVLKLQWKKENNKGISKICEPNFLALSFWHLAFSEN